MYKAYIRYAGTGVCVYFCGNYAISLSQTDIRYR